MQANSGLDEKAEDPLLIRSMEVAYLPFPRGSTVEL